MKKKKTKLFSAALAVLLAAAVTGCSGGNEPAAGAGSGAASGSGSGAKKDELVVAIPSDPGGTWDPIDTFTVPWATVASNIFDGLVERGEDLKLEPGLAESWTYKDPKTLEFKLRQGVTFQDGEPFNAEAVKFTFDRLLGPDGEKSPQRSNYDSIDKVEVVDDHTVVFKLKAVDPVLITKLAGYGAMIVPPKYYKEVGDEQFNVKPIGTGPFKVTDYVKDDHVTLEAYPEYWGGAPKLKKITYRYIPEATTRIAELQTGAVDIASSIPPSQASTIESDPNLTIQKAGSPTVSLIRFDVSQKPLDNVKVRQAINYAINKQEIIDTILNGFAKPISSLQGDISFGNNPDLKPYPFDVDKAKQLLQEAGVQPGTKLTFSIDGSDAVFKEVAQAVATYLSDVGLTVEIKPQDTQTMYNDLIPKAAAGSMYQFGWGGWTLDFDNTAYLLYKKGQFWNPSYSNPEVDKLLDAERSSVVQDDRKKIFFQLTQLLKDEAVDVPLYQTMTVWGVNKKVAGFVTPPDERLRLKDVSFQ
ncbi:ABC transporter substrate-binding protein [Paenibacillus humicola]|uniref:ABC transporter substrate-binding protein n=1 Tax=Paenibacillus humicola TaxID=3110540 RepID=UPI00237ADB0F|nr:ABC transporter substrate-binding protein [Paenibacillus humicola]